MTTKENLAVTAIVSGGLLLAITAVWLAVAPKLERQKLLGALFDRDRLTLTIMADEASREK